MQIAGEKTSFYKREEFIDKTYNYGKQIGGEIISITTCIESSIGAIIDLHYPCYKNENKLSKRIKTVGKLFQETYPEAYKVWTGLLTDLNKITSLRNKFAHYQVVPVLPPDNEFLKESYEITLQYLQKRKVVSELIAIQHAEEVKTKAKVFNLFLSYLYQDIDNRIHGVQDDLLKRAVDGINKRHPNVLTLRY